MVRAGHIGIDARLEGTIALAIGINDREVEAIDWTPPARPFFAGVVEKRQRECPQGDSNP
jgi:hypothetical protein